MDKHYHNRYKLWLIAFIQVGFLVGTTYGWDDLEQMLEREGYWTYDGVIDDLNYDLVWTLGSWVNMGGRLFTGIFLDRFGVQKTAIFGCSLTCIGLALLAFSKTGMNLVYPAFIAMSWGGPTLLLATQALGDLFINKALVISSLICAASISTIWFTICNVLSENGVNDDILYVCYAAVAGCFSIQCKFVYPKRFSLVKLDDASSFGHSRKSMLITSGRYDEDFLETGTLWEMMFSLDYLFVVMYNCFYKLFLQYYVMTLGTQTQNMVGEDMAVQFTICLSVVSLSAIGAGYCLDKFGFAIVVICNIGFSIATLMFLNTETKTLQCIGFVFYVIARLTTFCFFFSFIGMNFGFKYWGSLVGVGLFITACFSLFQYVLVYIVEIHMGNDYYLMNMCLAVWCGVWGGLYGIFLLRIEKISSIFFAVKVNTGTDESYITIKSCAGDK